MKKILSFTLSLVLIFTLAIPAFAESTAAPVCPSIYVSGFLGSTICTDKNDPSTKIKAPSSDELTELVKAKLVPAIGSYIIDGDSEKVAHELCSIINYAFGDYFNNPDGTAKGNSGAYMPYPAASHINKYSQVDFEYDWRGDPLAITEDLSSYIDYILESSGCSQVTLRCHSLGSVIATTYLSLYGNEKIAGIVFDSPALNGINYIGELLCGNTEFAGGALLNFLHDLMGETEYEEFADSIIDVLELSGMHGAIGGFLNELLSQMAPVLYKETLVPLFVYWPTVWAMTPDSLIEKAMQNVFTFHCIGDEYAAIKEKIDLYNTKVRANKKQTLLDFDEVGRIAVISRYGYSALPVSPSWNSLTDTVIDTCHTSLGATTTEIGKSFDENYLKNKDMSLISPDRTIDASTCLFPEKTWFIKNIKHGRTDITVPLHIGLLYGEAEATVDNYEALSRFMIFDYETETLSKDETVYETPVKLTPLQKIINFIKAMFDFLVKLFQGNK